MNSYRTIVSSLALACSTLFAGAAHADAIPYPTPGIENPLHYTFTAAADGDIVAYFFGSSASYVNELRMLVNGVDTGIQGLNNHTSAIGAFLNFGAVHAGDVLIFEMVNLSPGGVGPWFSDASLNSDGKNHIYSTAYTGGTPGVPAGTYVAFEDLNSGGDFNYRDETFVFTNVATTIPEPASLALVLGAGLAGFGVARRRH